MDAANPYAPPQAPLADGGRAADPEPEPPLWRLQGRVLLVRNGATLPDVCLFTGEPTTREQRLRLPMSWTPIWFRIAVVMAPLLALVGYSAIRRSSTIELGLGRAGRQRRRLSLALTLCASANGILLLFLAAAEADRALIAALALGFPALIVAALVFRVFRVVRIERRCTHLSLRPQAADAFSRLPAPPVPAD